MADGARFAAPDQRHFLTPAVRFQPSSPARLYGYFLLACWTINAPANEVSADPIHLPQAGGGELVLNAPAARLIALSPHLAELVFAAGGGDRLAATVEYSDYPAAAGELPRVGDAFRVDVERIHQLDPDLIIAWQSGNPSEAVAHLSDLGFNVWVMEILRPGEIADAVEDIGRATGTSITALPAASDLRRRIADIELRYAEREPVQYFYQVDAQPLYTVTGAHLISRGLNLCGGENVFADLTGLAPQVGLEAVLAADPRALLAPLIEGQPNPLDHWRDWPRLQAVRQENFVLLPADAISRATPRFIGAVELACAMLDDLRTGAGAQALTEEPQ